MASIYASVYWVWMTVFGVFFFFQAEDGIRDRDGWLEFRRVLFRSLLLRAGRFARSPDRLHRRARAVARNRGAAREGRTESNIDLGDHAFEVMDGTRERADRKSVV